MMQDWLKSQATVNQYVSSKPRKEVLCIYNSRNPTKGFGTGVTISLVCVPLGNNIILRYFQYDSYGLYTCNQNSRIIPIDMWYAKVNQWCYPQAPWTVS